MSTFLQNWMNLRAMSAPRGGTPSNIIYQLTDYTCDGTVATAINTGIYLFDESLYPNGWDLYLDITNNPNNMPNGSFVRCRNSALPYNGFTMRANYSNILQTQIQLNDGGKLVNNSRHIITIEKSISNIELFVDGGNRMGYSLGFSVVSPLVIGGELSDDTTQQWNNNRFGKCTIHSLVITAK